jgi:hypothetical protein
MSSGRSRDESIWLYVEDEPRWVGPLRRAAARYGRRVVHVDPSPASKGDWSGYPNRLWRLVEATLERNALGIDEIDLAVLDIYYPAGRGMPASALARHRRYVAGGILLSRHLRERLGAHLPIVFYSHKVHQEMRPAKLKRLLAPRRFYYLLKIPGGAHAAVRWLTTLDHAT